MANKMLVDASHPEETRVVVVRGSRIEEFDFESEHKKQLKGNIYLAKVTRVEPSLQAAFVEYGGNRHGFLAFSEIHPDYYQIPVADRQALIEDELARAREDEESEERASAKPKARGRRGSRDAAANATETESVSEPLEDETPAEAGEDDRLKAAAELAAEGTVGDASSSDGEAATKGEGSASLDESESPDSEAGDETAAAQGGDSTSEDSGEENGAGNERGEGRRGRGRRSRSRKSDEDNGGEEEAEEVDEVGAEDAMEEVPVRQRSHRRQYKIQEVIKRRQILLVQVVKEERGNKGAALTTYLSLAGRYSVLMPNTARGGGISRKITNPVDRKRLKEVARDLDVPRGMGIILRTAGANRTKAEVKRDYEYLMRLWETVRSLTLSSTAPTLVYEEGSLIKRSIRDLYNKDIDQILVSGDDGYREAKDFMRMLMPSQAKVVQPYRDPVPIFARQGIEAQLDRMLQPHVTLKSGGYIIINQTEALVAIDVNSGRSTREHSVEDTAFQTNLEAAEEVARQLRLRDLAGLIVIDFIDMEEKRNNRAVEKKLKDCLKNDRARIQLGRISHFGLMEMSRQRIRASVLESTMQSCPVCEGAGLIRSSSSLALHVLRSIEEHLQKHSTHDLIVRVPTSTALYVLNEKRGTIDDLERRHGLRIVIEADDSKGHQSMAIEHGAEATRSEPRVEHVHLETVIAEDIEADDDAAQPSDEPAEQESRSDDRQDGARKRKRRRRRRRDQEDDALDAGAESDSDEGSGAEDESADDEARSDDETTSDDENGRGRKRRRRGRRGGRRSREGGNFEGGAEDDAVHSEEPDAIATTDEASSETEPRRDETNRSAANDDARASGNDRPALESSALMEEPQQEISSAAEGALETAPTAAAEIATPIASDESPAGAPESEDEAPREAEEVAVAASQDAPSEPEQPAVPREPQITSSAPSDAEAQDKPKRTGWWARRSFF